MASPNDTFRTVFWTGIGGMLICAVVLALFAWLTGWVE